MGAYLLRPPVYYAPVVVGSSSYYYYGGSYYILHDGRYQCVYPPVGAVVYAVPAPTTIVYAGEEPYYYYNGAYYTATQAEASLPVQNPNATADAQQADTPEMVQAEDHNYEVTAPPVGATVPYLPEEAKKEVIGGKTYYVFNNTYYRAFASDGDTVYMVVDKPS